MLSTTFALLLGPLGPAPVDEGMWLPNQPPKAMLKERYDFAPDASWYERVQKASLRVSTGGSASIVSPHGLVFTNHHVASSVLAQLSNSERDLLTDGYTAATPADELKCPDLELLSLQTIVDITDKVQGAVEKGMSEGEAAAARQRVMNELEEAAKVESEGLKPEIVTLYQGGAYHLYLYKSYTDVRLVFAPEKSAAFFGGDVDNFEYPRYCLDVTFFRIYEDGQPLYAQHYLPFNPAGCREGDLVMISGHPGSTERGYTAAHVAYLRDVQYPKTMERIYRREVQLAVFGSRSEEWRRMSEDDLFSVQNARKLYTGMLSGLRDPALMAKKREDDRRLQAYVWSDPQRAAQWGDAWDEIDRACEAASGMYARHIAIGRDGLNSYCTLFNIAKDIVRASEEKQKPNAERLPEYTDAALKGLEFNLFSPAPIYLDYEVERMESWLGLMAILIGADDPTTQKVYAGLSPRARAEQLVRGSALVDVAARRALYDSGAAGVRASDDPLVKLVRAMDAENRALRARWAAEVSGPLASAYAKIAAARFAFEGDSVYPDATFTLRLATGTVKAYEENGVRIAPFTTFSGLYERASQRAGQDVFELSQRWIDRRDDLDLAVPYNFAHTCDSTGGNSGSPTIDREGKVVGILFDGNIHGLICDLQYTEVQARSISVDVRGVLESIESVYQNEALLKELLAAGR